jgi:hypothetical protein
MSVKGFDYKLYYENKIFKVLDQADIDENNLREEINDIENDGDTYELEEGRLPLLNNELETVLQLKGIIGNLLPPVDGTFKGRNLHDDDLILYLVLKICKISGLDYDTCASEQKDDLKQLACRICYWVSKYVYYDEDVENVIQNKE